MARRRRRVRLSKPQKRNAALVVGAIVLAAGGYWLYRRRKTQEEVASLDAAVLAQRPGDGALFFVWLAMWRARLIDTPLRLGDLEFNTNLLLRGFDAAGSVPASTGDNRASLRALCTKYKERVLDGTLRPIPEEYTPRLRQQAETYAEQWARTCADVNINVLAPA